MTNGGIEKEARKALRRMIFFRFLGDVAGYPQCILRPLQGLVKMHAGFFKNVELTVFQLELEAARRYKLLTGIDLPTAAADPGRYGGLDTERNEQLQQQYMDEATSGD